MNNESARPGAPSNYAQTDRSGTGWRIRVQNVRERNSALHWTLSVVKSDRARIVAADTTRDGLLLDLQGDDYLGTTGDAALDWEVEQYVLDLLAGAAVGRLLDAIDKRRWGGRR